MTPVSSILRQATNTSGKLRIITSATHERIDSFLSRTGHEFYLLKLQNQKGWTSSYAALPKNFKLVDRLPTNIEYDLVLIQNVWGAYQQLFPIAQQLHIPSVRYEHTYTHPTWTPEFIQQLAKMKCNENVFISKQSQREWGFDDSNSRVIIHGMDTELFKPNPKVERQPHILTVANDYINRDWCLNFKLYQEITKGLPTCPVGDTPQFSKAAANTNELVKFYQSSRIFLNTSSRSPLPTSLIESMSAGCAVVSSATCLIPEVIQNGKNGFISNDPKELRGYLELLLKDEKLARKLGSEARKTVLDKFSLDRFLSQWNEVFDRVSQMPCLH